VLFIGVYCPGLPAGRWGEQSLADCEETQVGRNQASVFAQLCAQNLILIFNFLMRQVSEKEYTQENFFVLVESSLTKFASLVRV
jgi:hypothetical protein